MKFYLDNNLSPALAAGLTGFSQHSEANIEVIHHRKKFVPSTPDVEWLTTLSNEGGWVVISGDLRITRNPLEQRVWRESGLTCFFLAKGWINLHYWEQARKLVAWWPEILNTVKTIEAGVSYLVPVTKGKLRPME